MIIAIDGPSGAGKSSVTKLVALELGFSCLDTGAMYRAITWKALEEGIDVNDAEALGELARSCIIDFVHEEGDPSPKRVLIDGIDVTGEIRTQRIDQNVSPVSAVPAVREALVAQQQRIGHTGDYIVEGRDIGTVVFPDAEVKVFLTASAEERARRRVAQNAERGIGSVDYDAVLADIIRRDEYDSSRDVSPLKPADDAFLLDSSPLTIEQVVQTIVDLAREAR